MNDYKIEQAIEALIAVADSNFPFNTDITISVAGQNNASIRIPSLALRGLLSLAREARESKLARA